MPVCWVCIRTLCAANCRGRPCAVVIAFLARCRHSGCRRLVTWCFSPQVGMPISSTPTCRFLVEIPQIQPAHGDIIDMPSVPSELSWAE